MKHLICLLILFCASLCADEISISHDKIMMTSDGIFINLYGHFAQCTSIQYLGNGIYAAEYYGQCGRCGWALNENGKCTNQNCNQYGPRERD